MSLNKTGRIVSARRQVEEAEEEGEAPAAALEHQGRRGAPGRTRGRQRGAQRRCVSPPQPSESMLA